MYDIRIGRWLSVDPMGQYASPYVGMGNEPVVRVDPDGGRDDIKYNTKTNTTKIETTTDDFNRFFVDGVMKGWAEKGAGGLNMVNGGLGDFTKSISFVPYGDFHESFISNSFYLKIQRFTESDQSTISSFKIGSISGYMLERPGPSTTESGKRLRIPEGLYNAKWHASAHFKTNLLNLYNASVSADRKILIHNGNNPKQTDGCLLIGTSYSTDQVGGSRPQLKVLNDYVKSVDVHKLRIVIKDIN